jgi:hypothetical protein
MSPVNEYVLQTEVRLTTIAKVGTVNTDPTTVTLRIRRPDGTVEVFTYAAAQITKDATGSFFKDYTPPAIGRYSYRWEGTGTVKAADEGQFKVLESNVL